MDRDIGTPAQESEELKEIVNQEDEVVKGWRQRRRDYGKLSFIYSNTQVLHARRVVMVFF